MADFIAENDVEGVEELGLSTARIGVIYVGGEIITSFIVLFLLIFLARSLQPAAYGIYTIAISFSALLSIASNFGIGAAFRKMIPEIKKDKKKIADLLGNGYFLASILGLVIALVGILISNYIAVNVYGSTSLTPLLEVAAVAELFTVLFNLSQGALIGLGKAKEATIANIIYSIIYLVASVGLVMLGYSVLGAVLGFLLGLVFGTMAGVVYTIADTKFNIFNPNKQEMKKLTKFSTPVMVSYIATQGAQNIAVLVLGVFATAFVVGNYGAAFKLARFVELIITTVTFVLLGAFSQALSKKDTSEKISGIYNQSIYYTALFLFPLIAYSVAVAQPIVTLLFSSSYTSASLYFAIIVVGMAIGLIGIYAGTLIVSQGDTKRFMIYQIGAVVIQLILLAIFTPLYQALGVLFSLFVVTPILLDFIYMRALEKQFKFKHEFGKLLRLTVASIIICAILFYFTYIMNQSKWSLAVDAIILILLFPPLAAFTGSINKSNLEFIQKASKRLKQLEIVARYLVSYTRLFVRE